MVSCASGVGDGQGRYQNAVVVHCVQPSHDEAKEVHGYIRQLYDLSERPMRGRNTCIGTNTELGTKVAGGGDACSVAAYLREVDMAATRLL